MQNVLKLSAREVGTPSRLHEGLDPIKDPHRRAVTAALLGEPRTSN